MSDEENWGTWNEGNEDNNQNYSVINNEDYATQNREIPEEMDIMKKLNIKYFVEYGERTFTNFPKKL